MPVDLPNLLIGLLAATLPLGWLAWHLRERAARQESELALLRERLTTAQLAQDGLGAQLEAEREAFQRLSGRHGELAFPALFHANGLGSGEPDVALELG